MVIDNHLESLNKLCRTYSVDKMYLFGSALSPNFNDKSDLDFLVKFKAVEPNSYFDDYMDFKEKLEKLFGRKIDLLEEQALRNPILIRSINRSKELIYG